jgi:dTDP-4-amino-4,6-dideoxygalactose transaminase
VKVPFFDLRAAYREVGSEIDAAVARVNDRGWYVLGEEGSGFAREWAQYCGVAHCVGVGNGLDALHLALLALDVGKGDEVIVPSNTYIATWLAVSMCGAVPVPVEPVEATYNLDPDRIEGAITPRTKVILPVHLYGQPADLEPILAVARRHDLRVLDDAAQAHGADYRGRRVGGLADVTAWSFYPAKNLGALGDGGAVTTDNEEVAERVRRLANYGSREKYVNEVRGFNSRLDEVHAAVLRVKLPVLDEWNSRRRAVATAYTAGLRGSGLGLPHAPPWAEPVWHQYVVRHPRRDEIRRGLAEAGVETLIHYPVPPHRQQAYADLGLDEGSCPISERVHREVFSLPMGPHQPAEHTDYVINATRRVLDSLG